MWPLKLTFQVILVGLLTLLASSNFPLMPTTNAIDVAYIFKSLNEKLKKIEKLIKFYKPSTVTGEPFLFFLTFIRQPLSFSL